MSTILVTGAGGAVGSALLSLLSKEKDRHVVATDLHKPLSLPGNIKFTKMDVRKDDPETVISKVRPDVVIHLASIVTPGKNSTRKAEYAVDVTGTENVLSACISNDVRRLVVTSSGAAYGYHPDNRTVLQENDPIRGNQEFAYSWHKRLVEEMLAQARKTSPQLEQVVFRVGTVLGKGLENQITRLFHRKRLLGLIGADSPFVFIWDQDLARILLRGATDGPAGIFNVAGDGTIGLSQIAAVMKKPILWLPPALVRFALRIGKPLGLTQYGPEQVKFLQYRPVLSNGALKQTFGYTPKKTSAEAFDLWWASQENKT